MDPVSKICNIPCFWEQFSETDLKSSTIREFYRGKVIFITGATGFLGQLYVEKLLRCEVEHIYLLARPKKNLSPEERMKKTFSATNFGLLKKYFPDFLSRLSIIEGDLSQLGLGIKEDDLRTLQQRVDIVIHSAADVRFQEKLMNLVLVNLRGTKELLKLAETFERLKVFTYISTAYSNCARGHDIEEKFYDCPIDPEVILRLADRVRDNPAELEAIEEITDRMIAPWPNTYTYTKSLSEEMVRRFGAKFPTIVIRPSIVISTYQEPLPAWANNVYGLNGVLVAIGMGFNRCLSLNKKLCGDIVCADFVINSTLAAIWATHEDELKRLRQPAAPQPQIYMVGSSNDRSFSWDTISKYPYDNFQDSPALNLLWAICFNTTTCAFVYKYNCILFHLVVGTIADVFLRLKKAPMMMMPNYRKIQYFLNNMKYFMMNEWHFDNKNMRSVLDRMSPIDQRLFLSDPRQFDYVPWSVIYMNGLKYYIIGDDLSEESLRLGRKKLRLYNSIQFFITIGYYSLNSLIIYGLAKGFGLTGFLSESFAFANLL